MSNYDNFAIDISAVQGQLYHIEILATPFVLTHWKNFNVVVDHTMVARNLFSPGQPVHTDGDGILDVDEDDDDEHDEM